MLNELIIINMNELKPTEFLSELNQETSKRKRKLLTDPDKLWAECFSCKEPGNLENLIRKARPIKDLRGVELYRCFYYVYFCSLACQGLVS